MADVKNKTVHIYIDHGAAENALKSLQVQADKLNKKIEDGRKAGKNMASEIKKLEETKSAIKNVEDQISKGLRPSMAQTQALVSKLRNELRRMSEDAPGYAEKFKAFRGATEELKRMQTAVNGVEKAQSSWLQQAKVVAFGVLIGNTVQSAIQAIGSYLGGILSGNAKLSDSLSDIEKTTGLSSKAVEDLNKELGKIDTRTKAADLRDIAVGLGQVGEQATKANVEAIDKIAVALGDEFGGGAKEITTSLSVLRNNLSDIKSGNYAEDILHIGNALNVAGSEGLATAPVVTDIANRIAGIARTFKLSSGQILGLAATFQELGIETERGSTAVTKLFQKIGAEPDKFAKVAGKSAKEFKDLVNRDMLGAFTAVAEGAKKAGSNNVIFSQILKELDADGSGAGEVLSKLGGNADLLAKKVTSMTGALKSGSSITDEFGKKNNNLAAELEKLQKKIAALLQSRTLTDIFSSGVRAITGFIDVLKAVPGFISNNKTAIALLVIGIATLNATYILAAVATIRDTAAKTANAVITRITAAATTIAIASQSAYIVVTNLLAGRIAIATATQRLWNISLSLGAGPIGVLLVAAGALVLVLGNLTGATKTLTANQQLQADVQSKIAEDTGSQISRTEELFAVAKDLNLEYGVRKKALDALISQNPEYLSGLTLENITTQKGVDIIDDYISALNRMAKAKALRGFKEDLEKQRLQQDIELKVLETNAKTQGFVSKAVGNVFGTGDNSKYTKALEENVLASQKFNATTEVIDGSVKELNFNIAVQQDRLKGLKVGTEDYTKAQRNLNSLLKERNIFLGLPDDNTATSNSVKPTATNPFGDKKTPEEKAAAAAEKKENDKRNLLLQQLKDFQFELSQVGKQADESEIARITNKYDKLITEATKYALDYVNVEKEKDRAIAFLLDQEKQKRNTLVRDNQREADKDTYKSFLEDAIKNGEDLKEAKLAEYSESKISKEQLEESIRKIDLDTLEFQIIIARSFVGVVKEASAEELKLIKQKNKLEVADRIKTKEQLEELERREKIARARVDVLKSRPGSIENLNAQKRELEIQRQHELDELKKSSAKKTEEDIVNQRDQINEEYRQREVQLTIDHYTKIIEETLGYISSALDIVGKFQDAKNAKEKAALDKELKQNDARKESIKRLEANKIISATESRRKIRAIEIQEERDREALEKKQNARNQRLAISQALINGALAVTKILAETPKFDFGIATAIQIGLAVATTAAQIATIKAQKFADGGKVEELKNGKVTASENIATQPNGDSVLATVKPGEVLLNEDQQKKLGGDDTFRAIGVPGFGGGGRVRPFWKTRPYEKLNTASIARNYQVIRFAEGGLVKSALDRQGATLAPTGDPALLTYLQQAHESNVAVMETVDNLQKQLAAGIRAIVSLKQLNDAIDQDNRINEASAFV